MFDNKCQNDSSFIEAHSVQGFGVNFQSLSSEYPACWVQSVLRSSYNAYFVSEAGCDGPG